MSPDLLPAASDRTLDETFRLAERIWRTREDLRRTYGTIENPEFWIWIMWHGPEEIPELERTFYPFPEPYLIERVSGYDATADLFRRSGIVDWRRVARCLGGAGVRFEGSSVLDFGCGSGRILRYFARYATSCRFTGADVDPEAVAWCRRTLTFAELVHIPKSPPTELPSAAFDAAFGFSIFTHLPQDAQRRWLGELARVLVPCGVLVLTIHGRRVTERWLSGDTPSFSPTPDELAAAMPALERDGIVFFRFRDFRAAHATNREHWRDLDLGLYGNTFIRRSYVEREWTRDFDLVSIEEAPDDWQDYVVLRRR